MSVGVRVRLTKRAQAQYKAVLAYSYREFGDNAGDRYAKLLRDALDCIANRDEPRGAVSHDDIMPGLLTLHLLFLPSAVKRSRHIIAWRWSSERCVEVLAILHDQMDLGRRLRQLP